MPEEAHLQPTEAKLDAFDRWWALWPPRRKAGKAAARKAYDKAIFRIREDRDWNRRQAQEYLAERLKLFAVSPKALGDFCPMPATWLNQGRYDDDVEAWQDAGGHGGQRGLFNGRVQG